MKTTPATEVSEVPNKKRLTEEFAPIATSNRQAEQSPEHMGLKTVSVANEVPGYTQLQQQIHDGLRAQHPEWVQPNGDSPICNCYESRFAELLLILARDSVNKKCVKIGNICGATSTRPLDYEKAQTESASPNQFHLRGSFLDMKE
jgi:hypothetical protein